LTLSPYVLRKLQIDKAQTRLAIDTFQLVCTPYRLSDSDAVVFAVLSPQEISYFQSYTGKPCALRIAFASRPGSVSPQLQIEGVLGRIGAVEGRENVALFALRFTRVPQALPRLLENFNRILAHLGERYRQLSDKQVPMENLRVQKIMGYRKHAELRIRSRSYLVVPQTIGVDAAELRLKTSHHDFAEGDTGTLRLDFTGGVATVPIQVRSVAAPDSQDTVLAGVSLNFDPLYVEILDRFFAMIEKASAARKGQEERDERDDADGDASELTEEA